LILENNTKPADGSANCRLAHVELLGGKSDVPRLQNCPQNDEQVEVKTT
jgi:hypothetical protein